MGIPTPEEFERSIKIAAKVLIGALAVIVLAAIGLGFLLGRLL